jgi:hypothetical protein
MQHEQRDYDNLADLWRSAQRRRTEDIYSLVVHFFKRPRQHRSSVPRTLHTVMLCLGALLPKGSQKGPKGGLSER